MSKKKRKQRVGAPASPKKQRIEFVARPFAGIANEEDLAAMAQILPAATASVRLSAPFSFRPARRPPRTGPWWSSSTRYW